MKRKNRKLFFVLMVLMANTTVLHANHAIMNPMHPIDMQISEDTPSENLKAELRTPQPSSGVLQLMAEDEMKNLTNFSSKNPGLFPTERIDCSKITMQYFQVLLQNPDAVEPEDYSCGLLKIMSQLDNSNGRIRSLEASLHSAATTIKILETSLQTEMSKTQFLVKELNETIRRETERAEQAEDVIVHRVYSDKAQVDFFFKNLTDVLHSSIKQLKELKSIVAQTEQPTEKMRPPATEKESLSSYYRPENVFIPQAQTSYVSEQDIQKIEIKLNSLQQFIQDLSNKISHLENGSEEHMNKGIAQIFKTYASLANDIEKEMDRATGEETSLKTLISSEIAALGKQITNLQDRITEEKNRVQIIESRRTADLFEEVNRAKSEEGRITQRLKEEMSKAAAAFKRLEHHVDIQLNSTKPSEEIFKSFATNATRKVAEIEEKLKEQIILERSRAVSVENVLKSHLDNEMQRALNSENEIRGICTEERERARGAENELRAAIDVEAYRAKGVEFSITAQITAEIERAKQEEYQLQGHIHANTTRLQADVMKELTRAQSAQMELTEKINQEKSRATGAEQNLLDSINSERSRATNKEQELSNLVKTQETSTKVVDQCKILIESEAQRAQNAETKLEIRIQGEAIRAKDNEEKILSVITEEMANWKVVERNLTQSSIDVVRHTRELELEVRKTVMAEVARAVDAENAIKQQLFAESERARNVERTLSQGQSVNHTEITSKMQEMIRDVEKDNLRLEDISLQISRNLTGDILTLAELFDDKLDDLERNENVRLKKLEEDMKKCCSGSSWRWRSPKGKSSPGSTAGTVINKIMQAFGAINEEDRDGTQSTSSKKSVDQGSTIKPVSSTGRSFDENQDYFNNEHKNDVQVPIVKEVGQYKNGSIIESTGLGQVPATKKVVYVHSEKVVVTNDNNEQFQENVKVSKRKPLRSSRRASNSDSISGSSNNKNSFVSVQSAHSKVTNRYG